MGNLRGFGLRTPVMKIIFHVMVLIESENSRDYEVIIGDYCVIYIHLGVIAA
jgi:hypothetical protein